jgi:hypothetical protein
MFKNLGICILLISALMICEPVSGGDLSGLWNIRYEYILKSVEVALPDGCTLAVFQNGSDIFGPCTGEVPAPWNGVFLGFNDSDGFELTITSLNPMIKTRFKGQSIDGILQGYFFGATEQGAAYYGTFLGSLMNPNPGLFEPARVAVAQATYVFSEEVATEANVAEEIVTSEDNDHFYKIRYTRDTIYPRPVI